MEILRRYSKLRNVTPTLEKAVALSRCVTSQPFRPLTPEVRVAHSLNQRLTSEKLAQMINYYVSGATAAEAGKLIGVSKGSAIRILTEYGVIRKRIPPTHEQVEEAVRLYAQGLSLEAAGQQVGLSATYLCRVFRERGIPTRRPWDHVR